MRRSPVALLAHLLDPPHTAPAAAALGWQCFVDYVMSRIICRLSQISHASGCDINWRLMMPYETIWEARGVYTRFFGQPSGKELQDHAKSISLDARASDIEYAIVDFLNIENHTIHESDALFAAATDSLVSNAPLVVLYSKGLESDLALIELHRNSPLMKKRPMEIFDNMEAARSWLEGVLNSKNR